MRYEVFIDPARATKEFANVTLRAQGASPARLSVDYEPVRRRCPFPRPLALDFLLVASCVYAVDKLTSREDAADRWTRDLALSIPVSDPNAWSGQAERLAQTVGFLTGDRWTFEFTQARARLPRPKRGKNGRPLKRFPRLSGHAVSLYSGGLDSLVGVIDWLEANPQGRLVMVGHHDPKIAGPNSDQERVARLLWPFYRGRMDLFRVAVGHDPQGEDTNYRSRSILFIALGVLAASSVGNGAPLLIPENGTISLNVPLTPSRRGSCSTRTTHPHFLGSLEAVLRDVGLAVPFVTPLLGKTKGECVVQCLGQAALVATARASRSCAKRGHTSHWVRSARVVDGRREDIDQCGRCVPCIFRRAALHAAGMDDEPYGNDLCTGEVDLQDDQAKANDLRAVLAFVSRNHSREEIAAMLVANGPLVVEELQGHADTVFRAMEEVRQLLRDKATPEIRRAAGV